MKNKLKLLIKDGLNKKINTKWFKVVNIILLVVVSVLLSSQNCLFVLPSFTRNKFTEARILLNVI